MDVQKKLMNKAGRLLGRRPYSRGELRAKLLADGSEQEVDAVLNRLSELELLNDAEYAYNYALNRARQDGWGPLRVRHALLRRQVSSKIVESALERAGGQVAEDHVLDEYLEKYCSKSGLPANRKDIQRLVSHLRRRGFHDDKIRSALNRKIPSAAWSFFDTGE